jgi:hypothetical protein
MVKKPVIPWELKYDFAMRGYAFAVKGFLYAIREKYSAAPALEIYERFCKMDERIKRLTNTLLTIFKIEGNDIETIEKWYDIWRELCGAEFTWFERSKTSVKQRISKCPFKTDPKDIKEWDLFFGNIVIKTINPKATIKRPKGMCAGDPYCEFITRIEE